MKHNNRAIKKIFGALLAISYLCSIIFSNTAVYAQPGPNQGGSGGDGGGQAVDCSATYNTHCTGAGWYKYPWPGHDVVIPSGGVAHRAGGVISGCGTAQYYWRFAFVNQYSREQSGIKSIGSYSIKMRAKHLGGRLLDEYYASRGYSWDVAKQAYADAWEKGEAAERAGTGVNNLKLKGYTAEEFTNPYSTLGWFCDWSEPAEPEDFKPDYSQVCAWNQEGLFGTENNGNTKGLSAVANLSKKEGWSVHTSDNGDPYTYARPGDSIQFMHQYCYGTSVVERRESWGSAGGRTPITAINYFQISAESNKPGGQEYRFGGPGSFAKNKLQDPIFDSLIEVKTTGKEEVAKLKDKVDISENNGFTVFSPSKDAGDRYDCLHMPFSEPFNKFRSPGYQVNGFTELIGSCKSQEEVGGGSDAGTIITQTLDWTYSEAWIKEEHEFKGECTCTANSSADDREAIINPIDSFPYRLITNPGGARYPSGYGCYVNGDCKQDPSCQDRAAGTNGSSDPGYTCDRWDNYSESPIEYRYPLAPQTNLPIVGTEFRKAQVHAVIPYNYNTVSRASLKSGDTNYIGEYVKAEFEWRIDARSNPDVHNEAYATLSRPTRVIMVEFMLSPTASAADGANVTGTNKHGGGRGANGVCSYYGGKFGSDMISCDSPFYEENKQYNETGSYQGSPKYPYSANRLLPDVEPGTKYCVAMGIWPADSHNLPDEVLGPEVNLGSPAVEPNSSVGSWRISNAACRTLHKKPNFQVWGAGIFTNAGITTSVSKKTPGVTKPRAWNTNSDPTHTFGSWDEYAVISGGEVRRFASAAGYGYQNGLLLNPTGGASGNANFCSDLSKLTLGGCNGDIAGKVQITPSHTIIERIKSRYTLSSKEINNIPMNSSLCHGISLGGLATCGIAPDSNMTYIRAKADIATSSTIVAYAGNIDSNGISDNRGTIIIDATGYDVAINNNICYLNEDCNNNNFDNVKLRSDTYTVNNIAVLPQVLIFADNIKIHPNVSQIDAWLIADNEINTCSEFVKGTTDTLQCNKILTINGPIFAKALSLNRTAGANPGLGSQDGIAGEPHTHNIANDGSITPAEIFNLRPDTYYWAYSQAQRFSQAVVTYSRELAPRY